MYTMSIQFDHNVFQIGVGEKLALSLDTSDTLVALVAIFLDAIASPSTYPCQWFIQSVSQ